MKTPPKHDVSGILEKQAKRDEERAEHASSLEVTLRDQFAMAALTGISNNLDDAYRHVVATIEDDEKQFCEGMAELCYILADAMLKARGE